jgi:hypothetical protein
MCHGFFNASVSGGFLAGMTALRDRGNELLISLIGVILASGPDECKPESIIVTAGLKSTTCGATV